MSILSKFRLLSVSARTALNAVPSRSSGHEHKMLVQPSNFQWNRFKDLLHFYVLLGVIPCTLISLYANIFIGEAELTDIPEGYVPEEHEYYKHPISRFFKKYLVSDRVKGYELYLARLNEESEKVLRKAVSSKLDVLMADNADQKSWHYRPVRIDYNRYQFHAHNNMPLRWEGTNDTGDEGQAPTAPAKTW